MRTGRIDDLKHLAKDLRQEAPRAPTKELGGLEGGARALDKCRASPVGWVREYRFGCPFNQAFARNAGIKLTDVEEIVATGASDEEIADWLRRNTRSQPSS